MFWRGIAAGVFLVPRVAAVLGRDLVQNLRLWLLLAGEAELPPAVIGHGTSRDGGRPWGGGRGLQLWRGGTETRVSVLWWGQSPSIMMLILLRRLSFFRQHAPAVNYKSLWIKNFPDEQEGKSGICCPRRPETSLSLFILCTQIQNSIILKPLSSVKHFSS